MDIEAAAWLALAGILLSSSLEEPSLPSLAGLERFMRTINKRILPPAQWDYAIIGTEDLLLLPQFLTQSQDSLSLFMAGILSGCFGVFWMDRRELIHSEDSFSGDQRSITISANKDPEECVFDYHYEESAKSFLWSLPGLQNMVIWVDWFLMEAWLSNNINLRVKRSHQYKQLISLPSV